MTAELLDQALKIVLMLIMFAIGATLRFSDFRRIFWSLRGLLLGLGLQMIFLPLFTFILVSLFVDDPYIQMGMLIVSLCPGGATSNFISYLVDADVALSISLTTINSFVILLTIPFGTNFFLEYFFSSGQQFSLPIGDTVSYIIFIILIPACLGLLVNQYFNKMAVRLRWPLKIINVVLLGSVYAAKALLDNDSGGVALGLDDIFAIIPVALAIHLSSMIGSYYVATRILPRPTSSLTIGVEVGLQNTTLALLISSVFLNNTEMAKPALVYSLFTFFTTLTFAYLVYRLVIIPKRRSYLMK